MKTKISEDLKELVRLGYGDCQEPRRDARSLDFKTEGVSGEAAKELVELIGQYNQFDPGAVKEIIEQLNGYPLRYQVGRESSPVIYVNAFSVSSDKREEAKDEIKELFKKHGLASEVTTPIHNTIRIWWD